MEKNLKSIKKNFILFDSREERGYIMSGFIFI